MTEDIFDRLSKAPDEESRELILLDFSLSQFSEELRNAVFAAAIPHWFDVPFLATILDTTKLKVTIWNDLTNLSFVERFPGRGYNVHERSRYLLLKKLWQSNPELYRLYSTKAAEYCFKNDLYEDNWYSECVYHSVLSGSDKKQAFIKKLNAIETKSLRLSERILRVIGEHIDANRLSDSEIKEIFPDIPQEQSKIPDLRKKDPDFEESVTSIIQTLNNMLQASDPNWQVIFAIQQILEKAHIFTDGRKRYFELLVENHQPFMFGINTHVESSVNLADAFYVNPTLLLLEDEHAISLSISQKGTTTIKRRSIWDLLQNSQKNLLLLGAPGTGKTTLLKYLALSLASSTNHSPPIEKTPVLFFLRELAEKITRYPNYNIYRAIQDVLEAANLVDLTNWLVDNLKNGRCLVMLDGLDEVSNSEIRHQVSTWIQQQVQEFSNNQFIVTSRPLSHITPRLRNTVLVEIQPFSIEQIREFIDYWYLANERLKQGRDDENIRKHALFEAGKLIQYLQQSPVLLELGINPLLLTMIATIHSQYGQLPDHRVLLFEQICDVFLRRNSSIRSNQELTLSQKKKALKILAYEMMLKNLRIISLEDAEFLISASSDFRLKNFLRKIANTSGLLIEIAPNEFCFSHRLFQEYFASVYVKENKLEHILLEHIEDAWWHETILLYSAQTNATSIIRACVLRETVSVPALTLAVQCLDEALEVDADLRGFSDELLLSIEDNNPEIYRIGAEIRLLLRLRSLVRLDERTYADRTLVTKAEYQLFLNDMRAKGQSLQPDHWSERHFSKGTGQYPVTGVRASDATKFCEWLSERYSGPWLYRLPTLQETVRISSISKGIAEPLYDYSLGYWFQEDGRKDLMLFSSPQDNQTLKETLRETLQNDLLAFQITNQVDDSIKFLQKVIVEQADRRQYFLLDLNRNLPFAEEGGVETHRLFNMIQNRNIKGVATDLQQALFITKVIVDNPSPDTLTQQIFTLKEALALGEQLANFLLTPPFPERAMQLMQQILRDMSRAQDQTDIIRQNLQAEFLSHREFVRHLNSALGAAQNLLDELNHYHTDALVRLRTNVLHRSLQLLQGNAKNKERFRSRRERVGLLKIFVNIYIDVSMLESRINGKTDATEGILIVRESTA